MWYTAYISKNWFSSRVVLQFSTLTPIWCQLVKVYTVPISIAFIVLWKWRDSLNKNLCFFFLFVAISL